MKALTQKRLRFIEEYVADFNATQAAIRAGYSPKTAYQTGHELLQEAHIAAAIAEKRAELARKAEITAESIARELDEARELAMREKQTSAAVSASMGKAKLMGLIVERHKHSGVLGTVDLSGVSDAELDEMERLRTRIAAILGEAADAGADSSREAAPPG